ncbi:hypothetical protein HYP71_gp052 [Arthrobacter phage KBurrousTX]|uniref:Uncharacterized protein n=1 Tax=Arthrobacter phage KBurrousTX TaxID=2315608 RepID=A0A386KBB2_9CAUD|nr:hypothetical protein HYP71_gp052 [Arthrobacter phage KBurrousTX]AYD81546.1 hypothetical protein KBurrousTX_52 [Arthrobacter phage KBurrousTX]
MESMTNNQAALTAVCAANANRIVSNRDLVVGTIEFAKLLDQLDHERDAKAARWKTAKGTRMQSRYQTTRGATK